MPIKLNSSGGGSVTLDVPSTASDFTATMPANTGTVITTGSTAAVTQGMLASGVAGNGPAFFAKRTADQTGVSSNTFTKIQFNVEDFDTANCYDSTTNYRFTPNVAGYYQVNAFQAITGTGLTYGLIRIYKNGSQFSLGNYVVSGGSDVGSQSSIIVYMNGTTDFLEVFGLGTVSSGTVNFASASAGQSMFCAALVRAA